MFVHLHGHSHYSLLEAIGKPADIVAKAKEYEMPAIAITDYNGMFGAVEFYQACQEADIKPIIGVELGFVADHTIKPKDEDAGTIVLIAQTYDGYQSIMDITSQANLDGFHNGKARADRDILGDHQDDIFCLLGGYNSYIGKMICNNEPADKLQETIGLFNEQFGAEYVLLEYIVQQGNKLPDLKTVNQQLVTLASSLDNQLVATGNFHYINKDDKEAFEVALAIKDSKRLYDKDRRHVNGDRHIMTEDEIKATIAEHALSQEQATDLLACTGKIAEQISLHIPMDTILFPKYESPDSIKQLHKKRKKTK